MSYLNDFLHRLRIGIGWIAAQFWAMLLLILAGLAWTRLPDKHAWQMMLSLLVPLLLLAGLLVLQAGTMRRLTNIKEGRARFFIGAFMLLGWGIVLWLVWVALDWCDARIPDWAGYLNSRASASGRSTLFTYNHLVRWFTIAEWILRWIAVPGKVILYCVASAQWGWHLPWRSLIRVLLGWRWWTAVIAGALVAVRLPAHFFTGVPHGAVSHQVWAVILKLAGAYLLAVGCWVLLVTLATVLLMRPDKSTKEEESNAASSPLPESGGDSGGNA